MSSIWGFWGCPGGVPGGCSRGVSGMKCASIMVPAFWIWVGHFRRYGKQLREYLENAWGMCRCRGACFFDVGGNISWLRETIKRICRQYNVYMIFILCLYDFLEFLKNHMKITSWGISWGARGRPRFLGCLGAALGAPRNLFFWCGLENFMGTGNN